MNKLLSFPRPRGKTRRIVVFQIADQRIAMDLRDGVVVNTVTLPVEVKIIPIRKKLRGRKKSPAQNT